MKLNGYQVKVNTCDIHVLYILYEASANYQILLHVIIFYSISSKEFKLINQRVRVF